MLQAITQLFKLNQSATKSSSQWCVQALSVCGLLVCTLSSQIAHAQETVCAEVKIEIAQELTIERQAFEAKLRIENTLSDKSINDIKVVVEFSDNNGDTVLATSDANNTAADFFIRVNNVSGINNVEGTGVLGAGQTAEATWLIIPAPGASDGIPSGKLVFVGARFEYKLDGIDGLIEVAPDSIYVKPMPLLGLDYFLPRDVFADDPLTDEVESVEPFTLGVRVQNNGSGLGNSIKIESAQPKIVENEQGLAIDFRLLNSFVQDDEVTNSLLIDFGDIASGESKMGRWIMSTSLSGRFTEFNAEYSHSDDLGGELTSLLENVETHFLLRDVIVDAPGRDSVKDFLSYDTYDDLLRMPDQIKVFESNSTSTPVTNLSSVVQFSASALSGGGHSFVVNPHAGFMYAQVADPFAGAKVINRALRSDGKVMNLSNVWLSKRYDKASKETTHYLNVFDFNTPGDYIIFLATPVFEPRPPVWQQVPFRNTVEGQTLGFIVQASDPDGTIPSLVASNLPVGATFTDNGNGFGSFQWTPTIGQAGDYSVTLIASDGVLSESAEMFVAVYSVGDSDGDGLLDQWEIDQFGNLDRDGTGDLDEDGVSDLDEFEDGTDPNTQNAPLAPSIVAPLFEATIDTRRPELTIVNSEYDGPLAVVYVFEVFSDAAYNQGDLVTAYYSQEQGDNGETKWLVGAELEEDTDYFWRVRASNSFTYSPWVDGRFRVNSENTIPTAPSISSPADGMEVNGGDFDLVVGNASDADGDTLNYVFFIYQDLAGSTLLEESPVVPQQDMGMTKWQPSVLLTEGLDYYWQAFVSDGIATPVGSTISSFKLAIVNQPPTEPAIQSPAANERVATLTPTLTISVASDDRGANNISYLFEIDSSELFESVGKVSSGWLSSNGAQSTFTWLVSEALVEDQLVYLRVKARDIDGLESAWVVSSFRVNASNTVPDIPATKNPGEGSQVITLTPKLEVHPVTDVDGDSIEYRFELTGDFTFATVLQTATVSVSETLLEPLEDDHIYYWRVKSIDETGAESEWGKVREFFVNENNFDNPPSFTWLLPEGSTSVQEGDVIKLRWQDEDLDSSATISLFYADNSPGTGMTLIADSLSEDDDLVADTYDWSTAGLVPGDYYLFSEIEDANSSEGVAAESVFFITIEEPPLVPAELISPTGSAFNSNEVTFTWNETSADSYRISVGTTVGGHQFGSRDLLAGETLSATYINLPTTVTTVYVRLITTRNGESVHRDYEFESFDEVTEAAELITPSGSAFNNNEVTFTWNDTGADSYRISVGTAVGGHQFGNRDLLAGEALSATYINLPTTVTTVYVRLITTKNGQPVQRDYEFASFDDGTEAAELITPSGSAFNNNEVTFTWNDTGADNYRISVGTTVGGHQFGNRDLLAGETLSATYINLPTTVTTVYVRLITTKNGQPVHRDYEFASFDDVTQAAELIAPSGSALNSNEVTFIWNDTGADSYRISVGTTVGGHQFGGRDLLAGETLSATYINFPTTVTTVYVRLITTKNGQPVHRDYEFASFDDVTQAAELIAPSGSALNSNEVTFTWNDTGADSYRISVGTTVGGHQFGNRDLLAGETLSATYINLPTTVTAVYVRLITTKNGQPVHRDYEFASFDGTSLVSPGNRAQLKSDIQVFTWKNIGVSADSYELHIGTSPGLSDIHQANYANNVSMATVNSLPTDGSKIYVRLRTSRLGVISDSETSEFTLADAAKLVLPTINSTLIHGNVTFKWTDVGADQYFISAGTVPDAKDVNAGSGFKPGTTTEFTLAVPVDGSSFYINLLTVKNGLRSTTHAGPYVSVDGGNLTSTLVSPANNSTLSGSTVSFLWNAVPNVEQHEITAGDATGARTYGTWRAYGDEASELSFSGLPTDSSTVHVRFYTHKLGKRNHVDYVFTADDGIEEISNLTHPLLGSQLAGDISIFRWEDIGTDGYELHIGSALGLSDIHQQTYASGVIEATIEGFPTDGSNIFAFIRTSKNGLISNSPTVVLTSPVAAKILSPIVSPPLTNGNVTFTWTDVIADQYFISAGTVPDAKDVNAGSGFKPGTTTEFTLAVPVDGSSFYINLLTVKNGLRSTTHAGPYVSVDGGNLTSTLVSPVNNSTLTSNSVTFSWTAVSNVERYEITAGSTAGARTYGTRRLFDNETQASFNNLPVDGSTVYVRLYTLKLGKLNHIDYEFTAHDGP